MTHHWRLMGFSIYCRDTSHIEVYMPTISLYTVYHKATHIVENPYIKPIQVGNQANIPSIGLRDNQGKEISDKNDSYCELTAQYWAWQNDHVSDYIGIMHYRRFFDFNTDIARVLNTYGIIEEPAFTLAFAKKYGMSAESVRAQIEGYDLILPLEWDVRQAGWQNIRQNYTDSPHHHERDLETTRAVIAEYYPDYLPYFDRVMQATSGYFTNMFAMRRPLFAAYSEWLFAVLGEVETRCDISHYDTQERRVFGYLSERLFNVWVQKTLAEMPQLKVNHLRRVFIHDTTPKAWYAAPVVSDKPVVSVVIAADNNYAPHLGALLCSILAHFPTHKYLDLLILDGGISIENRAMLMRLMPDNAKIQFLELSGEFTELNTHMHFSRATFYRLILDTLLPEREKVLYIDCDTIVLDDISTLFEVDLGNHALGAVFDYIMHHFCQTNVPSIDFTGSLKAKEYLQTYVGLGKDWENYFQAGVILFNVKKLRQLNISEVMISALLEKRYWFLDQDILNKYFRGDIIFLDPSWNVVNCGHEIYAGLPDAYVKALQKAEAAPKLIHYAGYEAKPWNNRVAKFSEYYFYYLRQSFWYEQVIFAFANEQGATIAIPQKSLLWRAARKCWQAMPYFMKRRLNRLKGYLQHKL